MKSLKNYIQEKLIIKKSKYNYFPETKIELKDIIRQRIKQEGNNVNLNDIDVSNITDMHNLIICILCFIYGNSLIKIYLTGIYQM